MSVELVQIVGIIAGSITAVSMVPQLIKVIKHKKVDHISIWMVITLLTGLTFWIVYGFLQNDMIIIVTNIFSAAVNIILLILKIKYKKSKNPT